MGRKHKSEETFARAASHLGYVPKEHFFEAMKAILAVQRDHGNREVRRNLRELCGYSLFGPPTLISDAVTVYSLVGMFSESTEFASSDQYS